MALILNIDSATDYASVCISDNEKVLGFEDNRQQKDHASFIQPAIGRIIGAAGVTLKDLEAVAITSGPGSYTGLRVGMASAKGLCYALNLPLITVNTLEVMAHSAIDRLSTTENAENFLFCPLVDARRMEVFTAVYSAKLEQVLQPTAMIIEANPFKELLEERTVVFFGSGSEKCKPLLTSPNSVFEEVEHSAKNLAALAVKSFRLKAFADLAYSQPSYLKEFYSTK